MSLAPTGNSWTAGTYIKTKICVGPFGQCYYNIDCPSVPFSSCWTGTLPYGNTGTICHCPEGYFNTGVSGNSDVYCCSPCSAGKYSDYGKSSCDNCGPGTFSASMAATNCDACPIGTFSSSLGASSCTPCPINTYAYDLWSQNCLQCPQFAPSTLSTSSQGCLCKDGEYFEKYEGVFRCQTCPMGTFRSKGVSDLVVVCNACPAGSYSNVTGAKSNSTCTKCPAGSSSETGSSSCSPCTGGKTSILGGLCYSCAPGTFSFLAEDSPTSSACFPCAEGYFAPHRGSSFCIPCASGFWSTMGASHCTEIKVSSKFTCSSSTRAVPSSLGLMLLPAAHPQNPQKVDLILAPLVTCQQLGGSCSILSLNSVEGGDQVLWYTVGSASSLNFEAAEAISCETQ